jgi:hypothetical protein
MFADHIGNLTVELVLASAEVIFYFLKNNMMRIIKLFSMAERNKYTYLTALTPQ